MARNMKPFGWSRVLVATDFSRPATAAVRSVEAVVRRGGSVLLVHVVDLPRSGSRRLKNVVRTPQLVATLRDAPGRALKRAATRLETQGIHAEYEVRLGRPWAEILRVARAWEAELVVVGGTGRTGEDPLALGSTAENVVRRSPVPVLVTRGRGLRRVERVVLPIDFDSGSRAAVRFALERLPADVQLEAFHVVAIPASVDAWAAAHGFAGVPEIEGEMREFLDAVGGSGIQLVVRAESDPAAEIVAFARRRRASLIVLSTQGRRGLARALLGSVAEKVVRRADRPVLVLPGPAGRRDRPAG